MTCQFGRCRPDGRLARNRMQGKNVYLLFIPVKNRHESQKNKYPRRGLCAALAARRRTAGRELERERVRGRESWTRHGECERDGDGAIKSRTKVVHRDLVIGPPDHLLHYLSGISSTFLLFRRSGIFTRVEKRAVYTHTIL